MNINRFLRILIPEVKGTSRSLKTILERIIIFYFLQKLFGTKGFFLEESIGKSPSIKICNNKILWVICSEFMSLWAGFNKKNMNMVCIMILGPFDAFRNSSFPLVLLFVFYFSPLFLALLGPCCYASSLWL